MKRKDQRLAKAFMGLFLPVRARKGITRWLFERMWKEVWLEQGYATQENIAQVAARYAKKRSESIDIIMTFLGVIPVGTVRFIFHQTNADLVLEDEFVVENRWQENDRLVEISLLTARRRFRKIMGGILHLAMFRCAYRESRQIGATVMVVATDIRVYRLLRRLGLPFQKIGNPKYFEGSIIVPAAMSIAEAEKVVPQDALIR